jgi:uncharacterized DUF497 family protein
MEFEYNLQKRITNLEKHKIDFEKAKEIWKDPLALKIPGTTIDHEPRSLVIGKIKDKVWSVIITERQGKTRIISARRARPKEIKLYEEK